MTLYKQIKRKMSVGEVQEYPLELVAANGNRLQNIDEVKITFKITTKALCHKFIIVPDLGHSMILGYDIIQAEGFVINAGSNSLIIQGTEYSTQKDEHMSSLARLTEDCTLEPQSTAFC